MMRSLLLIHRWLGVAFCLLFAMWFATGIVMHFVPFPALTETERVVGLPSAGAFVEHGPADAVAAGKMEQINRIRLIWRRDGGVYLMSGGSGLSALRADDLTDAAVISEALALAIASDHARQRGLDATKAAFVALTDYDQWTVPNRFDPYRPLYRIALNDKAGTELYIASVTGEVLLDTARAERRWNYLGSVVHWIYPTALRKTWVAWDRTVWWLSLAALVAALSGAVLGSIRFRGAVHRIGGPRRGWRDWHHVLGLVCMTFVLTWSLSGWLSMDHGRLFSRGQLTSAKAAQLAPAPDWSVLANRHPSQLPGDIKEIEWFGFDRKIFRRERTGPGTQRLSEQHEAAPSARQYLSADDVRNQVSLVASGCESPTIVDARNPYPATSSMPGAPVFRSHCGSLWFDIDGASGATLEFFDGSRRAYRWLYQGLHTLDFGLLTSHPALRTTIIVGLCGLGLLFSVTGIVIGYRRLRSL